MVIEIFDLELKVVNDVFNITLSFSNAHGIVLDQFSHHSQHIFFVILFVNIIQLLYFDETLEVIVALFKRDDLHEIFFVKNKRIFFDLLILFSRRRL
jgi:hypothetical protein